MLKGFKHISLIFCYSFYPVHRGGSRVGGVRGVDWQGLVIQSFNQKERRRRRNEGEKERKT